ncbi:MAG: hypothetical protein IIY81_06540 [Lachnospiraceae bacterium]|nr:hypothetical protein [Lachnospiraceae bacterium]
MKLTNKTKDYIVVIAICVVVIWLLSGAVMWVRSLFAEETKLSDIELQNKYYVEQNIQTEMRFLAMWDYTENMSTEEYIETFLRGK